MDMKGGKICRLLLLSSLGTMLLFAGTGRASEKCMFKKGGPIYCEYGCCSEGCCVTSSSSRGLYTIILIVVCVIAGLIIVTLIIVSIVCLVKAKKRDKEMDLAETGGSTGPAAGIMLQSYSSRQLRLPQTLQQETTFTGAQSDHTPQLSRPPSGLHRLSSVRPSEVSLHKEHIDYLSRAASNARLSGRRQSNTSHRLSSVRPSEVSLHKEDIDYLSRAASNARLSGRRQSNTILVQEREPAQVGDKDGHSQDQSESSSSLRSDGKKSSSHDREQESLGSKGPSRAGPLSGQAVFVHRKSIAGHNQEQPQDDYQNARRISSHRRRGSDPTFVDPAGALVSASTRPSIPKSQRVRRGSSRVFSQEDEEIFKRHSGNKRFTQVRHSDGFLHTTKDDIPLSSILRPLSTHEKKFASVHFEQEHC